MQWDRVGRVALVIVLFCVMASYLNPVVNLVDAWRDSKAGTAEVKELRLEHERLQNRVEAASTAAVLEREARRLGKARPGERVYVIRGLSD